jgi:hypothetical protein
VKTVRDVAAVWDDAQALMRNFIEYVAIGEKVEISIALTTDN